jgi:hypothetical protein
MAETKEQFENRVYGPQVAEIKDPWTLDLNLDQDVDKNLYEAKQAGIIVPQMDVLKGLLTDALAGDREALDDPRFKAFNFDKITQALDFILKYAEIPDSLRANLIQNPWSINFRQRPPTPEEFLTEKYIGAMSHNVWPHIKQAFCDFFDPSKPYRTACLAGSIGAGKSLLTVLINFYISTHFALMWAPFRFFNLSVSTVFTQVLCAVSMKKASELLFEPFLQILEQSPYFTRVRTHHEMLAYSHDFEESNGTQPIPWSTSTPSSNISMANGVNYKLISNANGLLGQTIICGAATELGFMREYGWSDEKIMQFVNKLRGRIASRMRGSYYGRFIIDSSPNTMESPIDQFIFQDAPKSHENFIFTGSRWKFFYTEFPDFETKKPDGTFDENHDYSVAFALFKGGSGKPPMVIENPITAAEYDPGDILWCPRKSESSSGTTSYIDLARENPIEFMRDYGGIPAGAADRIFYQPETIDAVFDNPLKNLYGYIVAPAEEEPEHLIWNQVVSHFFYKVLDKYYFYYKPEIPRVLSVDQSLTGDLTCVGVSHNERDSTRKDPVTGDAYTVVVTDFTIMIAPKGGIINLDAIKFFIMDLIKLGNLRINRVSFDQFQSASSVQYLKRSGIEVEKLSVDSTNDHYLNFIDLVMHGRYHCGKNIFMRNNMRSLYLSKRKSGSTKIDHFNGDLGLDFTGDWDKDKTSQAGYNAKDAADTIAANCGLLAIHANEFTPITTWTPTGVIDRSYDTVKKGADSYLKAAGFIKT